MLLKVAWLFEIKLFCIVIADDEIAKGVIVVPPLSFVLKLYVVLTVLLGSYVTSLPKRLTDIIFVDSV